MIWNVALGKFSCHATALPGHLGHTKAALLWHSEPFLAPWLWHSRSCWIFQEDAGFLLTRLFSEIFFSELLPGGWKVLGLGIACQQNLHEVPTMCLSLCWVLELRGQGKLQRV